jgi:hypothetical protein
MLPGIAPNRFRVTNPSASWYGIDPFRYLADVLRRLPTTPRDRLTELLPEVWFLTHPRAARKGPSSSTRHFHWTKMPVGRGVVTANWLLLTAFQSEVRTRLLRRACL